MFANFIALCTFHVVAPDVSESILSDFYELRQTLGLITEEMSPIFPCSSA